MPRTVTESKREDGEVAGEYDFVEIRDMDGRMVRIPKARSNDLRKPQRDSDGVVPEFVNMTGKVINVTVPYRPSDSMKVRPCEILRGSQWRKYSLPNKAWGDIPYFIERKHIAGKFDSEYLLEETQMVELIGAVINPHFGPRKLEFWMSHAKIQKYDTVGRSLRPDDELREDRKQVLTILTRTKEKLEVEKKRRDRIMTTGR